jgi:protease I
MARTRSKTSSKSSSVRRGAPRATERKGTRRAGRPKDGGARIAVILGDMFEDSEYRVPVERLKKSGQEVVVVGVDKTKTVTGKKGREKIKPDRDIDEVSVEDFDALVIPGGYSPDHLRTNPKMVSLTRDMFDAGKPVAAICHAGSMLIEAEIVDERTVTSWPSIRTDLVNAGAHWVDMAVAVDENLITSRMPEDLPAFTDALLHQLGRD